MSRDRPGRGPGAMRWLGWGTSTAGGCVLKHRLPAFHPLLPVPRPCLTPAVPGGTQRKRPESTAVCPTAASSPPGSLVLVLWVASSQTPHTSPSALGFCRERCSSCVSPGLWSHHHHHCVCWLMCICGGGGADGM